MKKKYRDIVVDGEQYAWTYIGYTLKIWKDRKVIMEFDPSALRFDGDDERYTNDKTVTSRTIAALIRATSDKERKDILKFGTQDPYIREDELIVHKMYNPYYGDERICKCGHTYYRHFDTFNDEMDPIGCKYCGCLDFKEKEDEHN